MRQYNVGDKVKIISRTRYGHHLTIGSVGVIVDLVDSHFDNIYTIYGESPVIAVGDIIKQNVNEVDIEPYIEVDNKCYTIEESGEILFASGNRDEAEKFWSNLELDTLVYDYGFYQYDGEDYEIIEER